MCRPLSFIIIIGRVNFCWIFAAVRARTFLKYTPPSAVPWIFAVVVARALTPNKMTKYSFRLQALLVCLCRAVHSLRRRNMCAMSLSCPWADVDPLRLVTHLSSDRDGAKNANLQTQEDSSASERVKHARRPMCSTRPLLMRSSELRAVEWSARGQTANEVDISMCNTGLARTFFNFANFVTFML